MKLHPALTPEESHFSQLPVTGTAEQHYMLDVDLEVPSADVTQESPASSNEGTAVIEPVTTSARLVKAAGSIVNLVTGERRTQTARVVVTDLTEERKRGGGGSWLLKEHMEKVEKAKAEAEAKYHESDCYCKHCVTPVI